MKVFLSTLGCRLNEAEITGLGRDFAKLGHHVVPQVEQADVVVINTCTVTQEASRASRKLIRRIHRENPGAKVAVTGCYASLEPHTVGQMPGVDVMVDNSDKDGLPFLLDELFGSQGLDGGQGLDPLPDFRGRRATEVDSKHRFPVPESRPTEPGGRGVDIEYRGRRTRAFVKVQDGCNNRCAFCVVTLARGPERSRPLAEVVDELNHLADLGFLEAVLTGVHLGGYGRDFGSSLAELLEEILHRTSFPRLRLGSLEPWELSPELLEVWRDSRLCPHVHLPLQSGSDDVLRRMVRRYTVAEYAARVDEIRAIRRDVTLTTDIIVGFPGETDRDFAQTMETVKAIGFGHLHIFAYSLRPKTKAARLPDQLPRLVKRERSAALRQVAAQMKLDHLSRFVGQVRPVLYESQGEDGLWAGLTDNYLRTYSAGADLHNRIVPTKLIAIEGETLRGQPFK
ncbi:MAG: tRNA (N(6)-L-threonylcarbamoyladenosine(37)-C(2))-methylthiotransferase MtaB [Proteobacteria bacterium]|jgi:threonylcarbamoyladenosine tRNA methylthiotransferase MtaB|nr:tRNA (N(6)-L-threonylcarbamoyladenosine(37)-C(2))-methylthiotransferase MtaB [Pseudomonadota bacterium]